MSAFVDGPRIFMKAILEAEPWRIDPTCLRMPWSEAEYALKDQGQGSKLSFAIMWHDGVAIPEPPYKRALEMVKEALQRAGHEVLDWIPYESAEFYELGVSQHCPETQLTISERFTTPEVA